MNKGIKQKSLSKQIFGLIIVAGMSVALGLYLVTSPDTERPADAGDARDSAEPRNRARGPHGGWYFTTGDFALELQIFETGVEPQFRVYGYWQGEPLPADATRVSVTLERLGQPPQLFSFTANDDHLLGDAVVSEPHSFVVRIAAEHAGERYQYELDQVEARVTIPDAQLAANGIELATAGPATIRTVVRLTGEVQLDRDRTVHVVPRVDGVVTAVHANAGDRVRAGQLLVVMSSPTLAARRSELLAAEEHRGHARRTYARERRLWEERISAEQDYLLAKQTLHEADLAVAAARHQLVALAAGAGAGEDLARYTIESPIDGVITEKHVVSGEAASAADTIFVIADLRSVWVETSVYARDLLAVRPGQSALVDAPSLGISATGTIGYIGPLVGEQTRTAVARIVLPNPDGNWRPGLPVTAEVTAEEVEVPVAVPAGAIQSLRDWTVVFGRYDQAFEARPITTGRSDGAVVEVLAGLTAGERYAASNSFLIKADIGKSGASHDH
jgi:membrane fusion protein, heavy metal efflux system